MIGQTISHYKITAKLGEEGVPMIGQTISHYKITAKLGEGGMGEVYLASDTNLDRPVAIKFLSSDRASDPEARQRFIHEAKAQAMLSHPNIATFHDVGEAQGQAFLVMEYVEGQPLPRLTRDEKLTLAEILDLIIQVGEGLQAAHEHGVVHRDIKPENVLVTTKRQVKITDFGLAKWKGATTLTKDGTRMGTAYYMSPEQAEGKRVDHRSDIFSLGVILYELVCRRRPFEGETETSIVYAVVSETPQPLARYCADVPAKLEHIVSKCLVKDPEERYQSAAEFLADLKALRRALTSASGAPISQSYTTKRSLRLAFAVVAGIAVVAAVSALVTRHFLPTGKREPIISHILPPANSVACFRDGFALSPDGRKIAFISLSSMGERLLWVRPLDRQDAVPLAGTDDASYPFWSPDGRQIAFYAGGKLKRVAWDGGPVQVICTSSLIGSSGGNWGSAGIILFSDVRERISSISEGGGEPKPLSLKVALLPFFLPDGRRFLYVDWTGAKRIACMASLDEPGPGREIQGASDAGRIEWLQPDRLVLWHPSDKTLVTQRVDLGSMVTLGPQELLAERISAPTDWPLICTSPSGTMAFVANPPEAGNDLASRLIWVDRKGNETGRLGDIGGYWNLRISPDGRHVAVMPDDDVRIFDVATGIPTRLTNEMASGSWAYWPLWSPRGDVVLVRGWRGAANLLSEYPVSGGQPREIYRDSISLPRPEDWSRDGRYVAMRTRDRQTMGDVVYFDFSDGQLKPFLATPADEGAAQFSPDTRWIAYESNETGTYEVYIRSFPGGEQFKRISHTGGRQPRWRADGRELFFLAPGWTLMAADVKLEPTLEIGKPTPLFQMVMADIIKGSISPYDVAPDGQRFLVISPQTKPIPLTLVQNWTALVDR